MGRETPEFAQTTIVVVIGLDATEIELRGGVPVNVEILPKPIPFNRLPNFRTTLTVGGQAEE